ncbi:hypothetical protein [Nicoliella lavandulae]|uniref:Uncharacterized protein n=1 Tax=Nicoliella lavandulae TaxID=3082954 RepID=A0ABU8SMR2_9LACO
MKKLITSIALATVLLTSATTAITTESVHADTITTSQNANGRFNKQVNAYTKLLNATDKTDLIKALIKSGTPTSLSDLGSKISLHSENEKATNSADAYTNAQFYLKLRRIFHRNINLNFESDNGVKLSDNLKTIKKDGSKQNPETVYMTGMGLGDSLDFGNRTSNQ